MDGERSTHDDDEVCRGDFIDILEERLGELREVSAETKRKKR